MLLKSLNKPRNPERRKSLVVCLRSKVRGSNPLGRTTYSSSTTCSNRAGLVARYEFATLLAIFVDSSSDGRADLTLPVPSGGTNAAKHRLRGSRSRLTPRP